MCNTEDEDQEEPDDGVPIVLVTGASDFVATHLIKQLLEQGRYRVRGIVRNKKQLEKYLYIATKLFFNIGNRMQTDLTAQFSPFSIGEAAHAIRACT